MLQCRELALCAKTGTWKGDGIAPMLFGDHPEEVPLRRAVTFQATVALAFWCAANFVVADVFAASLEHVEFESASQPLIPGDHVQGLLARPDGAGPFPAIVGLHGCDGMHETTMPKLVVDLVASGYVTLLVDSFATRGIDHACTYNAAMAIVLRRMSDAYGALAFLAHQPFVDSRRVAVAGFSQGGWLTLLLADTRSSGSFVVPSDLRLGAAVAFYPPCSATGLRPGIPTLILIGAVDDWTPSEDCTRKVVSWGTEGAPIEQVVYPHTHHGFYNPRFQPGRALFGHWVEYNGDVADDASVRMRQFLNHHLN
jgi:dienelactone hydrolase